MSRLTIGTAGHVDHGKTRLIEALTGIDCDRFAEEKQRGITIDLGFAHLERDGVELSFIDVPGHHRFVPNALNGLGGIDLVLLVVAADEGVKPQTREHLEICRLLEIGEAVVALSRIDLADPDLRKLARSEVEGLLRGTAWQAAPIVPVSSVTGEGLDELAELLVSRARARPARGELQRPARLPIDRAFRLHGRGTIVTGTLAAGSLETGDQLELLPGGERFRIREIQVHGKTRPRAEAGQRTALQLSGSDLELLRRGLTLAAPDCLTPSRSLLCTLDLLPEARQPLVGWRPVIAFHGTAEVAAEVRAAEREIEPGGTGIAEVKLSRPVAVVRGDRIILRRPSPAATIAGGRVLDPAWRRRRGSGRRRAIAARTDDDATIVAWAEEGGEGGVDAAALAHRLGEEVEPVRRRLDRLCAEGRLIRAAASPGHEPRWLAPAVLQRTRERARRRLERHFRRHRLSLGLSKAEATEKLLSPAGRKLAGFHFDWLQAAGVLEVVEDEVRLPGRTAELQPEESRLASRILKTVAAGGLEPPPPRELSKRLEAKPAIVEGVIGYLLERRQLIRLSGGLLVAGSELDRLRAEVTGSDWETFTVADFKRRFELTRKWAIPLLEYLDSSGVTRRRGDLRVVVRPRSGGRT